MTIKRLKRIEESYNDNPTWRNYVRCLLATHESQFEGKFSNDRLAKHPHISYSKFSLSWFEKVCAEFDQIEGFVRAKNDYRTIFMVVKSKTKL